VGLEDGVWGVCSAGTCMWQFDRCACMRVCVVHKCTCLYHRSLRLQDSGKGVCVWEACILVKGAP
jgi:hypothetical protein